MPKQALKKKCANPNCTNPKCPFPHVVNEETKDLEIPPVVDPVLPKKKQIQATYVPSINREFMRLRNTEVEYHPPRPKSPPLPLDPDSPLSRICVECRQSFVLTITDQKYFAKKSYSLPKRCRECRQGKLMVFE